MFAGSTEEHHDEPAQTSMDDQLEARGAVENVVAHQSATESAVMLGVAEGMSHEEIAEKHDLSHGHVRNIASSFGEKHAPRLRASGYVLLGVAFASVVFFLINQFSNRGHGHDVAHPQQPEPKPETSAPAPESTNDSVESRRQQIRELRAAAHAKALEKAGRRAGCSTPPR